MKPIDPTPDEIRQICLEIQSTWTPDEKLRRLRPDLRPQRRLCDGRMHDIEADDYAGHHGARAILQDAD